MRAERIPVFDKEKCTKCHRCVDKCPLQLLVAEEGEFPEIKKGEKDDCVECSTCIEECEQGAVAYKKNE